MLVGEGFLWNVLEARGLLNGGRAGLCHGRSSAMSSLFLSSKNSSRDISPSWEENAYYCRMLVREIVQLAGFKPGSASCSFIEQIRRYMYNISYVTLKIRLVYFHFL